jgi:hypothetical protein
LLKKVITYTNPFTDEKVTEEHYFHISKADLVEMEMEENKAAYTNKEGKQFTGMQAKLQQIVDSEDGKAIMAEFKDIIRRAYGKKEGDRFLKSSAIWEEFAATEAYSQLIFEICTDAGASAEFINGIIPNNLEQIAKEVREQAETAEREEAIGPKASLAVEPSNGGTPVPEPRTLTREEAAAMEHAELSSGLAEGRYKLS